ncbi:hypothetical protein S40288_07243 [Stachybotrys chartarum IBT 40288]|nr:hypothetical protein S40288_07243 [Stachybotrys chartarum IBT 40288]
MDSDPALARRVSRDTVSSLQQLDPSPIESPPPAVDANKRLGEPQDADTTAAGRNNGAAGSAGQLGLSGTGRGPIFYLTRIQKYSSYAMALFTSLHVANVSLIPAVTRSVAGSETYLLMTREIYQTALTEPLLVALPAVAHVGSGVALRLWRRWQNQKRYGNAAPDSIYALHKSDAGRERSFMSLWPPLSYISMSGYVFTIFYSAHAFTNRILPLVVDGDSSNIGLAYVAHGFARHPLISWAAYIGLIAVGSSHMVWGAAKWLGQAPSTRGWFQGFDENNNRTVLDKKTKRQRRRKWLGVHGAAVALATVWAVGGLGVVARGGLTDGWIGKVYDNLFAQVGL